MGNLAIFWPGWRPDRDLLVHIDSICLNGKFKNILTGSTKWKSRDSFKDLDIALTSSDSSTVQFFFYRIWNKWKLKNLTGSVKKTGQEVFAVFDLNGKFENLSKLLTGLLSGQTTLCTSMAVIAQLNFETLKTLDRFNQLNQTTAEGAIIFRRWSWEFPSPRWFFDKNTFPKQNRIISYYFLKNWSQL